jgi:hypothetical protein
MELKSLDLMKIICIMAVSLLICLVSCKDNTAENTTKTFDKELWKEKDVEGNYSFRDDMLDDLVYKVKLKGLAKEEVIKMLGAPDRTNGEYLYYEVLTKEMGLITLHKKFLVIKLAKDNTVEWRKIKD